MNLSVLLSWCLCLALLGAGCALQASRRPDWHYRDGVEGLLQLSQAGLEGMEDLTAEASITFRQGGQQERGTALFLFKNPDLLRVEVRGPLYSHVFTVLLEADSLTVYGAEGAWKGLARGPLLMRLTGIDLGLYDLKYALWGLIEPGAIDSSRTIEYPRADRVIVPIRDSFLARRVWLDLHRGFVIREEILLPDGAVLLRRELHDYGRVGHLYLPHRVEIHQGETSLILEFRTYIPDKDIPEKSFTQGIPLDRLQRVE